MNTTAPQIKWISPRFDAVINEKITIICQLEDEDGISEVELWADSTKLDDIEITNSDSIYTLIWYNRTFSNGNKPLLSIKATDTKGNDTLSQQIRVIIDNNQAYPEAVSLYPVDSIFVDSVLSGYKISWWYSGDPHFNQYILEKSSDPLMKVSTIVFTSKNKSIINYNDYNISNESIIYYRLTIKDSFGKQTFGNVISTSAFPMPPQWNIESIEYTKNSLKINWENPSFDYYNLHQILYSDQRNGDYSILIEYEDSLQNQYSNEFSPFSENWFSILTQDSIGQKSISKPYMHPPPNEPQIDSILYDLDSFRIQWKIEPDIDFINYQILSTIDENPYNLSEIQLITSQIEDTLIYNVLASQYYLFQVITNDAWGLQKRGPIILSSSFKKFITTEDNVTNLEYVIPIQDGKYIAIGESDQSEGWLLKYDVSGALLDSTNFSNSFSTINGVTNILELGYYITGSIVENQDVNIYIKHFNLEGNLALSKVYKMDFTNVGNAISNLSDGSIVVTGFSNVSNTNQDLLVMKIDPQNDGASYWTKTFGGYESDIGHSIIPSDNGGMFILGETHSMGDIDGDMWIIELNSYGMALDTMLIQIPGKQIGYSFLISEDKSFVIAGETSGSSGVRNALILEIDKDGEIIWIFNYGGTYNDIAYSLVYSDAGWVIAGQTYSNDIGGGDAWIVKVDLLGNFVWMQTYGTMHKDIANDISIADDGGFIICGSTIKNNNNVGWLIKTDSRGNYNEILSYP